MHDRKVSQLYNWGVHVWSCEPTERNQTKNIHCVARGLINKKTQKTHQQLQLWQRLEHLQPGLRDIFFFLFFSNIYYIIYQTRNSTFRTRSTSAPHKKRMMKSRPLLIYWLWHFEVNHIQSAVHDTNSDFSTRLYLDIVKW